MPKLSPSLKALINEPSAQPGVRDAPGGIEELFQSLARDANARKLGLKAWLTIATATTLTLNSPASLSIIYSVASSHADGLDARVQIAECMREVVLKCISFNGIPRTINCLNAFRASLPQEVQSRLCTSPSRKLTAENVVDVSSRGLGLWVSIYRPHHDKLLDKLSLAHPDLPVHILSSHYSALLSDPPSADRGTLSSVGRVHTSIVAISCLRAQTGVGPQVLSHVFGLRKAMEDGSYRVDSAGSSDDAIKWLASDEGCEWILRTVDKIVNAMGGSSFAPLGRGSKL